MPSCTHTVKDNPAFLTLPPPPLPAATAAPDSTRPLRRHTPELISQHLGSTKQPRLDNSAGLRHDPVSHRSFKHRATTRTTMTATRKAAPRATTTLPTRRLRVAGRLGAGVAEHRVPSLARRHGSAAGQIKASVAASCKTNSRIDYTPRNSVELSKLLIKIYISVVVTAVVGGSRNMPDTAGGTPPSLLPVWQRRRRGHRGRPTDMTPLCRSPPARRAAAEVVIITRPATPRWLKRRGSGAAVGGGLAAARWAGPAAATARCVEIDYENYLSWSPHTPFLGRVD